MRNQVSEIPQKEIIQPLRFDIQFLRAVAVLMVVLYHIPYAPLESISTAWWIGVDIFFVISGYLILGMLLRQKIDVGRILIGKFLAKRALRLVPSTIAVVTVSGLTLWYVSQSTLFLALELRDAGASLLSLENLYLIFKSEDYLAADQLNSPFTHFWSLGVEEQFYVVAGLTLFLVFRGVQSSPARTLHRALWLFIAMILIGLALSGLLRELDSPASYFNPIGRVWEFALGGLAAVISDIMRLKESRPSPRKVWIAKFVLYLVMTVAVVFGPNLGLQITFPGWEIAPILTLLCAALILGSLEKNVIKQHSVRSRFSKAILFLGKRSYLIYLWHLPVIFLFSNVLMQTGIELVVLSLTFSLTLSAVTGVVVEDRFRRANSSLRNISTLLVAVIVSAATCLGVAGLATVQLKNQAIAVERSFAKSPLSDGEGVRLPKDYSWAYYSIPEMYGSGCHSDFGSVARVCTFGVTVSPVLSVALVGDSHATQLAPGLKLAATTSGASLVTLLQSNCSLDSGFTSNSLPAANALQPYMQECVPFTRSSLRALEKLQPDVVILARASISDSNLPGGSQGSSLPTRELLIELKEMLPKARILVFRDPPRATLASNLDIFYCSNRLTDGKCNSDVGLGDNWDGLSTSAMELGLEVLSITDQICDAKYCKKSIEGMPIYRDSNHLNAAYSMSLGPYWVSLFREWTDHDEK